MSFSSFQSALDALQTAATNLDVWSDALPLLAEALGGIGGCCFACNDLTGGVEWITVQGPAATAKAEWVEHYASSDPFLPVLMASAPATCLTLSERLSTRVLQQNEWYQDYLRPSGIGDVIGIQLHHTGPVRVMFGLHYAQAGTAPSPRETLLRRILPDLQNAARLGTLLRRSNLAASVGNWMLDHLQDAFFVTYDRGRVVAMNAAAEAMLERSNTVALRDGRLVATDPFEYRRLSTLLAEASAPTSSPGRVGRMLIGAADPQTRQVVTIIPLGGRLAADESELVGIRIVSPAATARVDNPGAGSDLARLFGLSPAEQRLAHGLMRGRTLRQLTVEFGLQMPTLRAQLRSVLAKCGVQRQVDLVQLLLRTLS
ncbi:MAG: helix-turn-helix transcriptional regulator [Proteobacteria bacterium]|nr:helix-turn-helix transcriptional regulator [Pseudomonadota bacterium]